MPTIGRLADMTVVVIDIHDGCHVNRATSPAARVTNVYVCLEFCPRKTLCGADYMVDTLVKAGVKRVCGVVGDSLNGFTAWLTIFADFDCGQVR